MPHTFVSGALFAFPIVSPFVRLNEKFVLTTSGEAKSHPLPGFQDLVHHFVNRYAASTPFEHVGFCFELPPSHAMVFF